jgi:hypothetical protein
VVVGLVGIMEGEGTVDTQAIHILDMEAAILDMVSFFMIEEDELKRDEKRDVRGRKRKRKENS